MILQELPLQALKLLDNNPRKISREQMKKLCHSLKEDKDFLKRRPVLVNCIDGEHIVYAGNQRVLAARKLHWHSIPCIVDENLDEEVMKKRIIKDNKTFGEFDWDILGEEFNLEFLIECGFDQDEIKIPEIEEKAKKEPKKHVCPECGAEF